MPDQTDAVTPGVVRGAEGVKPPLMKRLGMMFHRLGPAGPLTLAAAGLPVVGGLVLLGTLQTVAPWLKSHGRWGPVLCVLGFAFLGGVALVPTYALSILTGWAFGVIVGFAAAMAGLVGAAIFAYTVARRITGEHVMRLIDQTPKYKAIHDALLNSGEGKTLLIVILLRLAPIAPFSVTNLMMAATRVPLMTYTAGSFLGMLPRTFIVVITAAGMKELDFDLAGQKWVFIAGIIATIFVIAVISSLAKRALARVTEAA